MCVAETLQGLYVKAPYTPFLEARSSGLTITRGRPVLQVKHFTPGTPSSIGRPQL